MFSRPYPPNLRGIPPRIMEPRIGRGFQPMMGMGQRMGPPMRQQGGGLLSKLLGKGNNKGVMNSFGAPRSFGPAASQGGGVLKALTNPKSISSFLTNTQKVLNTAQQISPMVQQYGPLVRNLPTMWKIYRGFKDLPSETEGKIPTEDIKLERSKEKRAREGQQGENRRKQGGEKKAASQISNDNAQPEKTAKEKGISVPKLYI